MKGNGGIAPEYGGAVRIINFVHSFYKYLPPEKYFDAHPEWYSEINGKRKHEHAQLCLTNEEMTRELIKNVLETLLKAGGEKDSSLELLSRRECEVLKMIAEGNTNATIAEILSLSVRTVEAHRAHIMAKLRLTSHAALVKFALAQGLIIP